MVNFSPLSSLLDVAYCEVYVVPSRSAGQPVKGVYVGVAAEYVVAVVEVGVAVGAAELLDDPVLPHLLLVLA